MDGNSIPGDLLDLLDAYCNGAASPDGMAQLEKRLADDPQAMDAFVAYTDLHASLQRWAQRAAYTASICCGGDALSGDVLAEAGPEQMRSASADRGKNAQSPILGFLGDVFQAGTHFLSRTFVLTLLFAICLPGLVLFVFWIDISRRPVEPRTVARRPATVAVITRESDCIWEKSTGVLSVGTRVCVGQRLQLREGVARLTFDDGAHVILEGPATLEIGGAKGGLLRQGSLSAYVPPSASGFAIETPTATVVDLGTEFGVSVGPNGTSEVHVFEGQVEVTPQAARTQRFIAGQAVKIPVAKPGQAATLAIAVSPERFARRMYEDLPRPTVLFAHRGSVDPVDEGWRILGDSARQLGKAGVEVGPVNEDGIRAWSIQTRKDNQVVFYTIKNTNGLTPELLAEARQKGWVLRARAWMSPKTKIPPKKWLGIASFTFRDGERGWTVRPSVDVKGNQSLDMLIGENAVIPIPGSRNRYVDYEIRCYPVTNHVDVFINHRLAVTRSLDSIEKNSDLPQIRFGGWRPALHARFALVEWGILRDSPTTTRQNNNTTPGTAKE
jgi:hypothetical protein